MALLFVGKNVEKKFKPKSSSTQSSTQSEKPKPDFSKLPDLIKPNYATDISLENKNLVITGIAAQDYYLNQWFGKSINRPTGLEVVRQDPANQAGAEVVSKNGEAVIKIATDGFAMQQAKMMNQYNGGESRPHISAHEYVHVYQFQNGCGIIGMNNYLAPRWLMEGEAEWLSYKALGEAGIGPSIKFKDLYIRQAREDNTVLKSLESRQDFPPSVYPVVGMAVDYLMQDKPIKTIDDFCAKLDNGNGQSVSDAFKSAFGSTLDSFYNDFENYRKSW